jgi:hypothetical protein
MLGSKEAGKQGTGGAGSKLKLVAGLYGLLDEANFAIIYEKRFMAIQKVSSNHPEMARALNGSNS